MLTSNAYYRVPALFSAQYRPALGIIQNSVVELKTLMYRSPISFMVEAEKCVVNEGEDNRKRQDGPLVRAVE